MVPKVFSGCLGKAQSNKKNKITEHNFQLNSLLPIDWLQENPGITFFLKGKKKTIINIWGKPEIYI